MLEMGKALTIFVVYARRIALNDALPFDLTPPTAAQIEELAADLRDEERHVLLQHGTEAPFCGIFVDHEGEGNYTCRLCGLPLFRAATKFESGTG